MYGTVMTESDKELARRIAKRFRVPVYWTEHDITELAAAFAAIREECAKERDAAIEALRALVLVVREGVEPRETLHDAEEFLRTAQPAKAQG
jgi:hypothetical protein